MNRKHGVLMVTLAACCLLATEVLAGHVTVPVTSAGLATYSSEGKPFHVLTLSIPQEISGMRLDSVILEFYVDADVVSLEGIEESPAISVRALTTSFAGTGEPAFSAETGRARPIVVGERRKVIVDITDIVKAWVVSPSSNHGLIVGALGESDVGDFSVRSDVLGGGKVATATFFYQNRFGDRISQRGR